MGRKQKKHRYSKEQKELGLVLMECHWILTSFERKHPGHFGKGILVAKDKDLLSTIRIKLVKLSRKLGVQTKGDSVDFLLKFYGTDAWSFYDKSVKQLED